VELRILGPVEVVADGREVGLGGRKQRSLLALLVVHRNESVSTDRLVDELWGEHPPETAAKTVQVYVSQLRKLLGDGRIETHGRGYLLRTGPDEVDLDLFQSLVERARNESPADALATVDTALRLFRGDPLQDVAYEPWAQGEIEHLDELRLAALAQHAEAGLALGRHAELVPELEVLVREHPLREGLRASLMLALYRSGRQADALETYRQGRDLLDEQLGLEPGPELRDLEQRILRQDPDLGAPEAPPDTRAENAGRTRRRRGLFLLGAGALLLLAAALAFAVVELTGDSSDRGGPTAIAPDAVGVVDPTTTSLVGRVPIVGGPSLVTAGTHVVWVASDASRTISSISTDSSSVTHVVAAGVAPSAMTADGDSVWVLGANGRTLVRLEPTYDAPTRRLRLSASVELPATNQRLTSLGVASGAGALWVTDGTTRLLRVDPNDGTILSALDVHHPLNGVAVGEGAVWAISGKAASVFQIDPHGRRVESRIRIVNRLGTTAPFPVAIAVGEGSVWVVNGNTQTVSKIDPVFGGVTATIQLGIGANPSDIAVGEGAAWVSNAGEATLVRIDARTNDPTVISVGSSPTGVAVGGGRVWLTVQPGFRASLARPRSSAAVAASSPSDALPAAICSPVEFPGNGQPRFLIASDLPFQGQANLAETLQMTDAVRFVLARHHFKAGRYTVGLQSCDDSIASTGDYDAGRCASNAKAYAAHPRVIGVIGTYNSGCTRAEIPLLEAAPGGPLPMISATSTYVGLTHGGPGTERGEPGKYYPLGTRNFFRVVAADDRQGAADALLAKRLGVTRLYVLHDTEPYGRGIAADMSHAAAKLAIAIAGTEGWDPHARSYAAIARRAKAAGANGVFLGGSVDLNGQAVVKDLRSVLGPDVAIITPDGFTPISPFVQLAGPAAEGVTVSFPAVPPERLRGEGRRFVTAFGRAIRRPVEAYSVATAQAAEALLDAIARSDGTRASVTRALSKTTITNGVLGSFSFDENGDTTAGAVTVYRIVQGKPVVFAVITPPAALVRS